MIKRRDITTLLEQGEISDSTFELLNDRISQYVDELGHGSVLRLIQIVKKTILQNTPEPGRLSNNKFNDEN